MPEASGPLSVAFWPLGAALADAPPNIPRFERTLEAKWRPRLAKLLMTLASSLLRSSAPRLCRPIARCR
eukprot:8972742-Pyramimonas_sp.AAC.1